MERQYFQGLGGSVVLLEKVCHGGVALRFQKPMPCLSPSVYGAGCSSWLLLQHQVCHHAPCYDDDGPNL